MKSKILGCLLVLVSTSAFGQGGASTTQVRRNSDSGFAAKGLQLSVFSYKPTIKAQLGDIEVTDQDSLALTAGASLGYAIAPASGFGWDVKLAIIEIRGSEKGAGSENIGRAEGNLSYSFNETVRFKFGPNMIRPIGNGENFMNSRVGGQAGISAQANSIFGVDLMYSVANLEAKEPDVQGRKMKISLEGLEVGVTATF